MRMRHPFLIGAVAVLVGAGLLLLWPESLPMMPGRVGKWIERAANVALFVPIALLVSLALKRWWAGLIIGVVVSIGAEMAQKLFLESRVPSGWDIAMNTTGAVIGSLLALVLLWRRRRLGASVLRPTTQRRADEVS